MTKQGGPLPFNEGELVSGGSRDVLEWAAWLIMFAAIIPTACWFLGLSFKIENSNFISLLLANFPDHEMMMIIFIFVPYTISYAFLLGLMGIAILFIPNPLFRKFFLFGMALIALPVANFFTIRRSWENMLGIFQEVILFTIVMIVITVAIFLSLTKLEQHNNNQHPQATLWAIRSLYALILCSLMVLNGYLYISSQKIIVNRDCQSQDSESELDFFGNGNLIIYAHPNDDCNVIILQNN